MRNVSDKVVDKIKTQVSCSITCPKIVLFVRYCGIYGRIREVTDDNTRWRRDGTICKLDTSGYKRTLRIRNTYCFSHGNNGGTNAPQCFANCTLSALYRLY